MQSNQSNQINPYFDPVNMSKLQLKRDLYYQTNINEIQIASDIDTNNKSKTNNSNINEIGIDHRITNRSFAFYEVNNQLAMETLLKNMTIEIKTQKLQNIVLQHKMNALAAIVITGVVSSLVDFIKTTTTTTTTTTWLDPLQSHPQFPFAVVVSGIVVSGLILAKGRSDLLSHFSKIAGSLWLGFKSAHIFVVPTEATAEAQFMSTIFMSAMALGSLTILIDSFSSVKS